MITIQVPAAARRNPHATALAGAAFRRRIVKAKSGKGSYTRKTKHKRADW